MKYKYYDKGERLIAESDSPIQFNVARFPIWKSIKPVIEEEKVKVATKVVADEVTKPVAEEKTYKSKKKKSYYEEDK
jgi:hypothetical protein